MEAKFKPNINILRDFDLNSFFLLPNRNVSSSVEELAVRTSISLTTAEPTKLEWKQVILRLQELATKKLVVNLFIPN